MPFSRFFVEIEEKKLEEYYGCFVCSMAEAELNKPLYEVKIHYGYELRGVSTVTPCKDHLYEAIVRTIKKLREELSL